MVQDHPNPSRGLMQILNGKRNLVVCGTARTVDQALPAIIQTGPELVLVDIRVPGKSGLDLIKMLRSVDRSFKLLVTSMSDEAVFAARVLRAGGDGYIINREDPDEIARAICDILEGHIYISEEVMENAGTGERGRPCEENTRPPDHAADSDLGILESRGRGKSKPGISFKLRLTEKPFATSHSQIKRNLKLKNARALFRHAARWVESEVG